MEDQRRDSNRATQEKEINVSRRQSNQNRDNQEAEEQQSIVSRQQSLYSDLANNELNNSLFPSRQENLPWYWRWSHKADIFNFQPVPKTSLVSTRRSQIASIIAILLMLLFVGYTVYDFFYNNTPRLNEFTTPIDFNQEYKVQDFAFGFYEMDTSSALIEDPTMFTYYLEQYIYSNKPGDEGHEELSKQVDFEYCQPEWAPVQIKMLCPTKQMYMQGMIGKGDYLKYPRIKILACDDNNTQGIKCDKQKAILEFPKGRFFIFIKQDQQINFATNEEMPESVPNLYDRAETVIGTKQITKYPNYGSTFQKTVYNYQSVSNNNLYVSDVSYFFKNTKSHGGSGPKTRVLKDNQFNLKDAIKQNSSNINIETTDVNNNIKVDPVDTQPYFAWWMSISTTQNNIQVNYKTSANMISLWGGLWGVLHAGFTFIYMSYNAKQFYNKNKDWDRFDNVIKVHRLSYIGENKNNHSDAAIQQTIQNIGDQVQDGDKKSNSINQ